MRCNVPYGKGMCRNSIAKTVGIVDLLPESYKNNRTKNNREAFASLLFLRLEGARII